MNTYVYLLVVVKSRDRILQLFVCMGRSDQLLGSRLKVNVSLSHGVIL